MPLFNPTSTVDTDPYVNDGATSPVLSSASGAYTEATITYPSTIDVAITNLKAKFCYDNGVSAAYPALLRICVHIHGYAGDMNSYTQADLRRCAQNGFFCVSVGMRGRNSASGSRDAGGREVQDVIDAIEYIRATYPTIVSPTSLAVIDAGSGGGGDAEMLMVKRPDYFAVVVAKFGISDYGYRKVTGWYDFGQLALSPTSKSYLDTDVGVRSTASDPYLARMASYSIAKHLSFGGFLQLFHDTADTSVSVEASRQVVKQLQAQGLGVTNYNYRESTVGDTTRWLHGHPSDHLPEHIAMEWITARRCREAANWSMPSKATITVQGSYASKGQNFEIWLGSTPNPRTNGTGGRTRIADVEYDTVAGTFKVTPLSIQTETLYVQIRLGTLTELLTITDTSKSYMIEFYGDDSLSLVEIIDASSMPFADAAVVATIPDASGNGHNYTTSNSPIFKTAGLAGAQSIRFNGTNQYAVCSDPVIVFDSIKKLSIAWVGQFSTITGTRAAFVFGLNTQGVGFGCNLNATSKFELEVPGSFRDDLAAADTSPHFFVVEWDGSNWLAEIDGVAKTVTNISVTPQVPITRSVLGAYTNTGTFPFHGDIGMRWTSIKNWNATQRAAIRAYAKSIWTALP